MSSNKILFIQRKAKVIVLLKFGKDPTSFKSYRSVSLLCHTHKFFERLLNRLTPSKDAKLIPKHAGFKLGNSCTSQLLNPTQFIEDGFGTDAITGAVSIDISVAYDTVHLRILTGKLKQETDPRLLTNDKEA